MFRKANWRAVRWLSYDWNIVAARVNEGYDAMLAGESTARFVMSDNPLCWLTVSGRSEQLGNTSSHLPDGYRRVTTKLETQEADLRRKMGEE